VDEEAAGPISRASEALASVLPRTGCLLAAVSGGPDSLALLIAAAEWARRGRDRRVFAATVDHGLRPESATEALYCRGVADRLGVAHATLAWRASKPETGLQAAAREARYGLLAEEARRIGATHIATAHHADDQAETVLMRLAAGSGIAGLGGMRASKPLHGLTLVRPFLGLRKDMLVQICRSSGLTPVEDASNADPKFGRARLRGLLPLLGGEGLTVERVNRFARRAAAADEALDRVAGERYAAAADGLSHGVIRLNWRMLSADPAEIGQRVIARALAEAAPGSGRIKLEAIETLASEIRAASAAKKTLRRTLAGRMITLKTDGTLAVGPAPPRRTV
jgi:tRNA(Ile)-lysidine synthase